MTLEARGQASEKVVGDFDQKRMLLMQVFQTKNDIGIALRTLHLHVLFHHHKDLPVLLVDQKKMHEV